MLSGVGDHKAVSEHGIYQARVPMHDGNDINISGLCLDTVTAEFSKYTYVRSNRTFIEHIELLDKPLRACQDCQAMREEERTS